MEKFFLIKNKRSQVWSFDLVVASMIFIMGLFIFYFYVINQSPQSKNQLEEFFYEGDLSSQLILSEDEGILSGGKINQTKLDIFNDTDYDVKKTQLGISNNFYFTIKDLEVNGVLVDYVGRINDADIENLVKVTRFTVYKNKPVKFEIFIWR